MERIDDNMDQLHDQLSEGQFALPASTEKYIEVCMPLLQAIMKGDWEATNKILSGDDVDLYKTRIGFSGETALQMAAISNNTFFVQKLLEQMEPSETEIINEKGRTALCFAAATGDVGIARLIVEKNRRLPTIRGPHGRSINLAATFGHTKMVEYLYNWSHLDLWTPQDRMTFLVACIHSKIYGVSLRLLEQKYDMSGTVKNDDDDKMETPLSVLARMPSAFSFDNTESRIKGRITNLIPFLKLVISPKKPCKSDVHKLVGHLWDLETGENDVENQTGIPSRTWDLLFVAAECGNYEFLAEMIGRYPSFLYAENEFKQSIFHIAVSHRYEQNFSLIYEIGCLKDIIAAYIDTNGNNMLHLAAILSSEAQNQLTLIPGAALQMQREVLWYKEVEKIIQHLYRNMRNHNNQRPYELFLKEHKKMMKEGETWMRKTAHSCMVVATLICSMVFTASFTLPGGYNNTTGDPILVKDSLFTVFSMFEAVGMISSSTSVLMFLAILTSRYAMMDFQYKLPIWLMIGMVTLFLSLVAVIVEFCSAFMFPFERHGVTFSIALLVSFVFAGVPLTFISIKYPLLKDVFYSTCGGMWLFHSKNRLFGTS